MTEEKARRLEDVAGVQMVIAFDDQKGFVLPMTGLQSALFFKLFGVYINSKTGELECYSDKDLREKFGLEGD